MKICLINSNISQKGSDADLQIVNFQRGLLSLAAALEKNGHTVEVVDLAWLVKQGKLEIDTSFHDNAARLITGQAINILGFNTRCDTYPHTLNIAKRCKELNPNSTVILGGPQATFTDEETLKKFYFVDIIVRGEGEETLLEIIDALNEDKDLVNIPGISYRENGCVVKNKDRDLIKDLDSLPLPAYHLMERYIRRNDKLLFKYCCAYIEAGRGCPYRCTFCASTLMDRNYNRLRSPENIIKEITLLRRKYEIKNFIFGHDHLLANRKIVEKICRLILSRKIDIEWTCSSRIDAIDIIDKELLKIMFESGCRGIFFGIESGSSRIQKLIRKNINLSLVPKVIQECEKYGISASAAFIVGFPEERKEDINATLELALKCRQFKKCLPYIRLLSPMAGTDIFFKNRDRLVFTGFRSDMSGGPLAELKGTMDLVKKHPLLFSVFYVIRPQYVPINLPHEAVMTFVKIIYTYPMSSYVAMKELKIKPLGLLEELKKWAKKKKLGRNKKAVILTHLENIRYFPLFLRDLYRQKKFSFLFLSYIIEKEERNCKMYLQQSKLIKQYVKEKCIQKSYMLLKQMLQSDGFNTTTKL